jgi:FkbM family methyltransferase
MLAAAMATSLWFRAADRLYYRCFPLYRAAYGIYKRLSDRALIELVREHVRPGMTALDVGGNIGFYARLLARLVGAGGTVHVFEPEPGHCRHLRRLAERCGNVRVHAVAAAERTGTIPLYVSDELNVDHRTYDAGLGRRRIDVPCARIDDVLGDDVRVGFVKLDVQGYDWHALMGMGRTLARSPSVTVLGEYWPAGLRAAGVVPEALLAGLRELGFAVRLCDEAALDERARGPEHAYTNYVATK